MNFYQYLTMSDYIRKSVPQTRHDSIDDIYNTLLSQTFKVRNNPESARVHNGHLVELKWMKKGRPFYNIWPGLVPQLIKLDLDTVPAELIELPLEQLCFRFSTENPFMIKLIGGVCKGQTLPLESLLVSSFVPYIGRQELLNERHALVLVQFNPIKGNSETVCHCANSFILEQGRTLSDEMKLMAQKEPGDLSHESFLDILKIIVSSLLLSKDPDDKLVMPVVLADDFSKWEATHDPKYVEKAKKRGNFGWHIGREIDVNPHWRKGHLAWFHVGKGRSVKVQKWRKGCIVKCEIVKQMPSGFDI